MVDRIKNEVNFTIHQVLGVLSESSDGWKKEATITSWNGGPPKVDIRNWSPDHERMTRGLTLFEDEAEKLAQILAERFGTGRR